MKLPPPQGGGSFHEEVLELFQGNLTLSLENISRPFFLVFVNMFGPFFTFLDAFRLYFLILSFLSFS